MFSGATTGYLSFGPVAQCAVHALKGLAQPRAWSEGDVSAEHYMVKIMVSGGLDLF